jgi:hypothetical protein
MTAPSPPFESPEAALHTCILRLNVLIASRLAGVDARFGRSIWEERGIHA